MVRSLAHDFTCVSIGEDEAGVGGQNIRWKIRCDGKQQCIAIVAVLGPFLVGPEVRNARLDFNNANRTVAADS